MRKLLIGFAIALSLAAGGLSLAGCSGTTGTGNLANQIKSGIQSACGFQVSVDTALALAGLLGGTFLPGSSEITSFLATTIDGVCNSIKSTAPMARAGGAAPVYRGVVIKPQ